MAKAKPEGEAEPQGKPESAKNPAADHKPPAITGADLMAGFKNSMAVARQRRLQALARTHPEIAQLLKSKVKTPTAEAPRIES